MRRDTTRGSLKALAALTIAVVTGGFAVVGLFQVVEHYQDAIVDASRPDDTVTAIVAAHDLYPGVVITEDDLLTIEIAPRYLPSNVFLSASHVVGQRPSEPILAKDLIRSERLSNPEAQTGLNAIIPSEMRAISVEIGDGAAVSGFVNPGSLVDVLVTIEGVEDARGRVVQEPETHTLLQNVFVLASNDSAQNAEADERSSRGRPTVTLLASPKNAETVAHAERVGTLRLTLRNPGDDRVVGPGGVPLCELLGACEPETPTVPRKAYVSPIVQDPPESTWFDIIRGATRESVEVEEETPPGLR